MSATRGLFFIEGVALWGSRLPGWEASRAILRGEAPAPEKPNPRPSPALLAPTERRRAPDTVAVALEVAAKACESARRDPKTLPSVFASTHGDLAISDYMCETLAKTPALTSPTKFHNSVHNAAAGYWTIGTGCLEPYTAVTAYRHTFGQGLLESAAQCSSEESPILYVAYDIESRGPLGTMAPSRGLLGGALVLNANATDRSQTRVNWSVIDTPAGSSTTRSSGARAVNAALVEGNAMADCLALFEALADRDSRQVEYSLSSQLVLALSLEPFG
jgi:hypothetical protein